MTDRRVGQTGASVDIKTANEQRIGAQFLQVDYVHPEGVQNGQIGAHVDLVAVNTLSVGGFMLMVDYVAGLATAGIGWDGTQFVASGATPVLWGASAFQSSGGYPAVQWETDHFEAEP